MLKIRDEDHFSKVVAFAERTGQIDFLWEQLLYLHEFGDRRTELCPHCRKVIKELKGLGLYGEVHLFSDFAPASFYWQAYRKGKQEYVMNGGLIYHGNQAGWERPDGTIIQEGQAEETFSVNLVKPRNNWSIHT